jgi:hypothetical protein
MILKGLSIEKEIKDPRHQKIIIVDAMKGNLLKHAIPTNIAIINNHLGQYNMFDHALC